MGKFFATISTALICTVATVEAAQTDSYAWDKGLTVEADLDGNGQLDSAQLGVAASGVRLLVKINSTPLPAIDIPIDGSKQFGICPGSSPHIELAAQSDAPLNALGEMPQGYEACEDCIEVVVSGGDCDPLHFYWDATTGHLAWWRE